MTEKVRLTLLLTPAQYADWEAYCLEHGYDEYERAIDLLMDTAAS